MEQGGSTITQQLAKFTFLTPERSLTPQGARGADRLLAGGVADQGRDPRTLSLQRLFRRQRLWPARREPALFLPPAREADARTGGDAGRAGAGAIAARADAAISTGPRRRGCGWCSRRWSRPVIITQAEARRDARSALDVREPATICRPAPISPTGRCREARDAMRGRAMPRQTITTTLDARLQALAARCDARAPLGRRAGGAGGDAAQRRGGGDDRRQGLRRSRRSTAPRRRGASRDRPSSCSSISPRCATGGSPTTRSPTAEITKAATGPSNADGRYSRDASRWTMPSPSPATSPRCG